MGVGDVFVGCMKIFYCCVEGLWVVVDVVEGN